MQQKSVAILICSVLYLAGVESNLSQDNDINLAPGEYPCGSVITNSSGIIQYKPFQIVAPFERCVWILRVPEASGYYFTFYNIGFTGSFDDNGLNIAGLHLGEHRLNNLNPSTIDTTYFVNGSLAILTFYTENRYLNRGFSFHYQAESRLNHTVSSNSTTEIVSTLSSNFSHPLDTTGTPFYSSYELSVFLFSPNFSNPNATAFKNTVRFQQLGLEGITCNDFLDVYTFKQDYPTVAWQTYGRVCGADEDVDVAANDMVLLAFHSDASREYRGFNINYARVQNLM